MRKATLSLLLLLVLGFAAVAYAYELHLGTIVSTGTSANNSTTGTPFTLPPGAPIAIQCDAAACVLAGSGSSTSASCTPGASNKGVLLVAGQLYDMPMVGSGNYGVDTLAVVSQSGTANCEVYRVVTQ